MLQLTCKASTSCNSDSHTGTPWNKPGHAVKATKASCEKLSKPYQGFLSAWNRHLDTLQTTQAKGLKQPAHPGCLVERGGTVSSCKPREAVIRGSFPTCSKPFRSKATALHHCTHLPCTAKASMALWLLHHSLRKPQSPPGHPGGAVGSYRWARACLAVCPWGDKPRRKWWPCAPDYRQSFCFMRTSPMQKSTCSWGRGARQASIPISSVAAAAAFFYLTPKFVLQNGQHIQCTCIKDFCWPPCADSLSLTNPDCKHSSQHQLQNTSLDCASPTLAQFRHTITSLLPERKSRPALTKWITASGMKLLSSRMNQDTGDPVCIFISLTTTQENTSKLFCLFVLRA